MLEEQLSKFGFDQGEASVFLVLLELGPSGISEIAARAKMNRTTLYAIFDRLAKKELLTVSIRGKRKVYAAQPPEKIKKLLQDRLATFDQLLPELVSRSNGGRRRPVLKYFEGIEGIKTVFRDSLGAKDGVIVGFSGIEALTATNKTLLNFWEREYIPKRKRSKTLVRLIVPENEAGVGFRKKDAEQYRESRMVSGTRYNFGCEIHAYDRTVAVISYAMGEEFALEIVSEPVADTVKMIFQLVWAVAY